MALTNLDDALLIFNSNAEAGEKDSRIPAVVRELCAHRNPFDSAHLAVEFISKVQDAVIIKAIQLELKAQSNRPKGCGGRISEI